MLMPSAPVELLFFICLIAVVVCSIVIVIRCIFSLLICLIILRFRCVVLCFVTFVNYLLHWFAFCQGVMAV